MRQQDDLPKLFRVVSEKLFDPCVNKADFLFRKYFTWIVLGDFLEFHSRRLEEIGLVCLRCGAGTAKRSTLLDGNTPDDVAVLSQIKDQFYFSDIFA